MKPVRWSCCGTRRGPGESSGVHAALCVATHAPTPIPTPTPKRSRVTPTPPPTRPRAAVRTPGAVVTLKPSTPPTATSGANPLEVGAQALALFPRLVAEGLEAVGAGDLSSLHLHLSTLIGLCKAAIASERMVA